MDFVCIEREKVQPTFMEIVVGGSIITKKIPVSIPLKINFTTQTGQLTHECVLFINKKVVKGKKKIYQLENGKQEIKNE